MKTRLKIIIQDYKTIDICGIKTIINTDKDLYKAVVDYYDNAVPELWYHQNETTGFTEFADGETITTVSGSGSATADSAKVAPGFDPYSGEILYIDNRNSSVTRSDDQTEDVKIIIQL